MVPEELGYTKEHEWARIEGSIVTVGVTDYAQHQLGDIVFADLPEAGTQVREGEPLGEIESTKSVSDLFSPVTGTVSERNSQVERAPEIVNQDPYGQGWLVKVDMGDSSETAALLTAEAYGKLLEEAESE